MLVTLIDFDRQVFELIYNFPHPFIIVVISEVLSIVGYFGIIWMILGYFQKRFKTVFITLVLVFIVVDLFLKFTIRRIRPFPSTLDFVFPWESFSFPSGHAAASFASAFILTRNKKQKTKKHKSYQYINILIWTLAVMISFSRVYLGRHYPLDIFAGAVFGLGISWIVVKKVKV